MMFIRKLFVFAWLQALSCIFPLIIFGALALTKVIQLPALPRYDWILLICLLAQAGMMISKLETLDELKVICMFHIIGLALEIFKVHMGSWSYPEPAWSKVFGVPLYSGFMYASVASYICQAWRRLQLQITGWPNSIYAVAISTAIYLNFFTHHFIGDYRWILMLLLVAVFFRCTVYFTLEERTFRMPLLMSFLLIGFFIWIAENVTTFLGAWKYPNQEEVWRLVHIGKISSWMLLVVISIIIVAQLKHVKKGRSDAPQGVSSEKWESRT